jgi:hypothetical protein
MSTITKFSNKVAARRLRDEVDIFSLGDPGPGRSALDALRAVPHENSKPTFSISAKRGDDRTPGHATRADRIRERAKRRRGNGPMPYRGNSKSGQIPQTASDRLDGDGPY